MAAASPLYKLCRTLSSAGCLYCDFLQWVEMSILLLGEFYPLIINKPLNLINKNIANELFYQLFRSISQHEAFVPHYRI